MASCDCIPVTFVGICNNAFYFDDAQHDEVDTDTFDYSKTSQNLIRCPDSRFLILNEAAQFDLKDLTIQQQSFPGYKFYIDIYKDLSYQSKDGRAVVLYALKEGKKIAAVCKDDTEICPEEMELQRRIEESKHRALFYMVLCQKPNKYRLRSSWYPDKSLGFDETDSSLKLVLRPFNPEDQLDTFTLC